MPEVEKTLRRPIDLTRVGKWIVSANHLEGSVSVIDTKRHTFRSETNLGGRIRSLAAIDQSNILLAVDEENHKLIPCNVVQGHVSSFQTADTAHTPIDVVVDRDPIPCGVCAGAVHDHGSISTRSSSTL